MASHVTHTRCCHLQGQITTELSVLWPPGPPGQQPIAVQTPPGPDPVSAHSTNRPGAGDRDGYTGDARPSGREQRCAEPGGGEYTDNIHDIDLTPASE